MQTLRMNADTAFRESLVSRVDEINLKSALEQRYGRGWQRKLGGVLDVPETTVSGWFKSGKFPVLAKLAFGVLLTHEIRPVRRWIPVKNGDGYAVCDIQGPVGRIVADNISGLNDAMLLAAAPQLYDASGDAFVVFDDARDLMEGWGELADQLGAGLDAATRGQSDDNDDATVGNSAEEETMKEKAAVKFDNLDRKRVIESIEEYYGVKLDKVGQRVKWLREDSGKAWWVLGGIGDWHGIAEEMMEREKEAPIEGMLVIAEKKRTSIEVFAGPLNQLVSSRDELFRTKETGAYQFTVKVRGDLMQCVQAPAVVLERILSIPHSDADRERERRTGEASKMIAALSPEELNDLLHLLGSEEGQLTSR